MTDRSRSGRVVAEPRLAILALAGVLVMMLSVVAILETDDIWIVVLTVLSIALIAVAIAMDLWRVLAVSGDDAQSIDADDVNRGA